MSTVCARTPRDVGTEPELRTPGAAAQTRMVSVPGIRLDPNRSIRCFKGIVYVDISEFESYMPSHAVGSLWRVYPVHGTFGRVLRSMVQVDAYAVQNYRELARDGDCGLSLLVV